MKSSHYSAAGGNSASTSGTISQPVSASGNVSASVVSNANQATVAPSASARTSDSAPASGTSGSATAATETAQLGRHINLPQAVALYIGAVVGSGILLTPGITARMAGPSALIAWGCMALLILPLALSMGLLSARYPNAGGVSHFVTLAFGPKLGALIGWFFLMSVPIGAPVATLTGAGYLTAALGWSEPVRVVIAAVLLLFSLLVNWIGFQLAGKIQVIIVGAIILVLGVAIVVAIPDVRAANFTPFMPHGWVPVGQAAAMLFWCFIGWEAVSHLSEEFKDPQQAAVRGVMIAAAIVGLLYLLTAIVTIGTQSYMNNADASLVHVIGSRLGVWGAVLSGLTAAFICTATSVAYIGAASRVAFALSRNGYAARRFSHLSPRFRTPTVGIGFLAMCFMLILSLYATGWLKLELLLQLPNSAFILTYLAGCAAGVRLLWKERLGRWISGISFLFTLIVFPFTGWAILYPVAITILFWLLTRQRAKSH
ncbi:APC family permease [Paenibacillus sp. SGZ-1009]|uniref:APC family permease n=1 Tax=Paenibacillus campi TaxID=3106031 RepID=UPI002AFF853B|nr:amino acid permease [Paenibacillus sp. SGZ-1009]